MTEHVACAVSDLEPGSATRVVLPAISGPPVPIAIARDSDGEFHALGDACTHDDVSLSEGEVVNGDIECWAHGSRFSLTTGQPDALPAITPVPVYPVRVDDGNVLVDVDAPMSPTKENA